MRELAVREGTRADLAPSRQPIHRPPVSSMLRGVPIDRGTRGGNTPLIVALKWGHARSAEALLTIGADPSKRTDNGEAPMIAAVSAPPEFEQAILDSLVLLGKKGATPTGTMRNGHTALTTALKFRQGAKVVSWLLDAGADATSVLPDGTGTVALAAVNGDLEVIKNLVEKGARIDLETSKGNQAIHVAANHGRLEVVEYLLGKASSGGTSWRPSSACR